MSLLVIVAIAYVTVGCALVLHMLHRGGFPENAVDTGFFVGVLVAWPLLMSIEAIQWWPTWRADRARRKAAELITKDGDR